MENKEYDIGRISQYAKNLSANQFDVDRYNLN